VFKNREKAKVLLFWALSPLLLSGHSACFLYNDLPIGRVAAGCSFAVRATPVRVLDAEPGLEAERAGPGALCGMWADLQEALSAQRLRAAPRGVQLGIPEKADGAFAVAPLALVAPI
jgi:hypothetical protein